MVSKDMYYKTGVVSSYLIFCLKITLASSLRALRALRGEQSFSL